MTELERVVTRAHQLQPRTRELYLQHIRAFLEFAGSNSKAWTADATQRWRDSLQARMSVKSLNVALNALRFAARRLKDLPATKIDAFVAAIQTLPQEQSGTPARKERALTWEEGRKLIKSCSDVDGKVELPRDLRDTAIVTLGLRTGMLRFSICKITLQDFSRRTIKEGTKLTFEKKGGERHTIVLDAVTGDALNAWTAWLAQRDITSGPVFRSLGQAPKSSAGAGALYVDRKERPLFKIGEHGLTPDGLYRALKERAVTVGIKKLRPHIFRKTFIEWAMTVGAEPPQIAAVTGYLSDGNFEDLGSATPANMLLPSWDKTTLKKD